MATLARLLLALLFLCDLQHHAHAWSQLASSTVDAFANANTSAPLAPGEGRRLLKQAFPGAEAVDGGVALPIAARHNLARGRGLLRSGVLPVDGSVNEVGYYYATVTFGTPARHFDLIIDTGSTITYVPCSDCGSKCGKHEDAAFDPQKSSTARVLGCAPQEPKCNCGSPRCSCRSNKCYFSRSYAEGSSSQGVLVEDVFAFPDTAGSMAGGSSVRIVFGCEEGETGEIFRQKADGLIGMGDNDNSFHSQLLKMGAIADSFALCFGYPSGGTMLLGDVSFPGSEDMVYTPLLRRSSVHYYTLTLNEITVGNKPVEVPSSTYAKGYGCVLDSGTTFLYLPSAAFSSFSKLVKDAAQNNKLPSRDGPDPRYKDICWRNAPLDPKQLHTVFPVVDMIFAGGAVLKLQPLQYLFRISKDSYCLGVFDNGSSGTLVGAIAVRNVVTKYDRQHQRVGFLGVSSCEKVQEDLARTTKPPPQAFPPPASPPLSPSPSPSPQPAALTPPTFPPQRTMPATPPELPGTQPTSGDEGTGRGQATPGDSSGDTGQGEGGAGDSGDNKGDGKGRDGEGDDSPGGSSNGSKQAKSGSIVGAWMDVVVVPMMFVVIGIMAWAAYMYRGVLTRQYQQLRTDLDQELVSPSTQYTRV
mmetsp:Transcript_22652/g.62543  ORF Transcript_22652/g.62543 Transcript_22652/m.62543 type:complete len:640 (-) Transcript_22652:415-2334(-)|eukprot:CAMPEP_0202373662 /NCGR_PEP_ID=MMETSP1127-20130417/4648_1 /ASSEMBLY_ACC=CAM_ASM_000462 /TAXON_ID=3047 /ORGANISM="Dunaliella tertiolecta, Strain CCMP1320" /LENGTH=639 /DNA_ID=CAMNT_0048970615 /DNA_START=30 /DNA_END=1949 /DNA_ORIENTATION=-